MSYAAPSDNVGMSSRSKSGGMVKIRDVMQRQMAELLRRCVYLLGARHTRVENRFRVAEDNENILGDRNGRKGVRSSRFSMPAPMALGIRWRK